MKAVFKNKMDPVKRKRMNYNKNVLKDWKGSEADRKASLLEEEKVKQEKTLKKREIIETELRREKIK